MSAAAAAPEPGRIAFVRQRRWLVERVVPPARDCDAALVDLACLDDDAQGQPLSVLWEHEIDARVLRDDGWAAVAGKGFDEPELFAAYMRTLAWNCVTATDPGLFQAPFRAGIRIDAWQLEPLRKALRLPRVNMFIADDVGLGKTVEAGLIARELLLRRRVDRIVVACPPAMLEQWRNEMEARFGLLFAILDRGYVLRMRRERGFSVNPWTTHSRFLVSHRLLVDEAYAGGLRDWLGAFAPQSLLIFDEAHHAAPASGARYAIDSQITRAVRDIAPRFEHRLFLSATPHNGHSNSFSALLEILDPQRFCRGVPVRKGQLDAIMVRRLKSDIRALEGGFPKRTVVQVDIDGLPAGAPELVLAAKLDAYRQAREERLAGQTAARRAAAALVIGGLQKRLLSSIEAFARTLAVHRKSVESVLAGASRAGEPSPALIEEGKALTVGGDPDRPDAPDDGEYPEDEAAQERDDTTGRLTAASSAGPEAALRRELASVDEMARIAEAHRRRADPRIREIVRWIRANMCPRLADRAEPPPEWNDSRLIVFTEYDDTRRHVESRLREAIAHTGRADERIGVFAGATPPRRREELQAAFNADPADPRHPLRILVATDAAREGLNLQRHCRDLFHFDLPWNPGRIDQRNGRIDRKLQPADEVFCRYFVFRQRPEDRVLEALVQKAETIREELGSAARVLEGRVAAGIGREGLRRDSADRQAAAIRNFADNDSRETVRRELEDETRARRRLDGEIDRLRTVLERSRRHIGIEPGAFRRTLSTSLKLSGAPAIAPKRAGAEPAPDTPPLYAFPAAAGALARNPGWTAALDALRERRKRNEKDGEWRRRAAIRPIAFEDTGRLGDGAVHLHLEHRVAQRLLGRFLAQGLIHRDLSKACLAAAPDAVPRVLLLGRLAVYGPRAARLHEEIVPVAARWIAPGRRRGALAPYRRDAERVTLESLHAALDEAGRRAVPEPVRARLAAAARRDIDELLPRLEERAASLLDAARARLAQRAAAESRSMTRLLEDQRGRIAAEAAKETGGQAALNLNPEERRQRDADRRAWTRRLAEIEDELESEPRRVARSWEIRAHRLDPLGIVYLWPRTG